jgi:hypothetical protein
MGKMKIKTARTPSPLSGEGKGEEALCLQTKACPTEVNQAG